MSKPKFVVGYEAALVLVESLHTLMEQRGISRADLARLADVERSTVTKWLTPGRNMTVFTAAMIADTLDADLSICVKDRRRTPRRPTTHPTRG